MTDTVFLALTLALGIFTPIVKAHGFVQGIVADGIYYQGYRPSFQYQASPPQIPAWSDPANINNGFINNYSSPDIICHLNATAGHTYAAVQAGGSVELQWTNWPIGHLGPVITYLANCNGNCTTVDKTKLLFNKIDQAGLIQGGYSPGKWAVDELIANNNSWTVQIPSDIAPGQYVLRHEIISLQEAMSYGGAQNYPQCVNLVITGSGSNQLQTGTEGTKLYTHEDPGLHIDIYQSLSNYTIPGPTLLAGVSNITRSALNSSSTTLTSTLTTAHSTGTATTITATSTSTTLAGQGFYAASSTTTTGMVAVTNTSSTSSSLTTSVVSSTLSSTMLTISSNLTLSTSSSTTTSNILNTTTYSTSMVTTTTTTMTSTIPFFSPPISSPITTTSTSSYPTTLQTLTRSDSSNSSDTSTTTTSSTEALTTFVVITVTVPGNFADPSTSVLPTPQAMYPFTNGTGWQNIYGSGTGTVSGTAWSTGTGMVWSSGTRGNNTSFSTGTAPFTTATIAPIPVYTDYRPRRAAGYVRRNVQRS